MLPAGSLLISLLDATDSTQTDNKAFFQEDLDIFDFTLSPAEMAKLNAK